jgi:hypothetical protein
MGEMTTGHRAECSVTHGLSAKCNCGGVPRTYSVIRNTRVVGALHKGVDTVEASGLTWDRAKAEADRLSEAEEIG